jgi:hypothetical protein
MCGTQLAPRVARCTTHFVSPPRMKDGARFGGPFLFRAAPGVSGPLTAVELGAFWRSRGDSKCRSWAMLRA